MRFEELFVIVVAASCSAQNIKLTDDPVCMSTKNRDYRSYSGLCNNRANPNFGKSDTAVLRILGQAKYADGLHSIRKSVSGDDLPSARTISNKLFSEDLSKGANFDEKLNNLHMQFGQFVAHDLTLMPGTIKPDDPNDLCLDCESGKTAADRCAPIKVPEDDEYFLPNPYASERCIDFKRARYDLTASGVRQNLNNNTHFLDLSTVYGSTAEAAQELRTFVNGTLKVTAPRGYTLPPSDEGKFPDCASSPHYYCFKTGDIRNSLHPGLLTFHVTYIKEHNRIAGEFQKLHPDWSDETIFQESRRALIAMHQYHVYNEYLPIVLGPQLMEKYQLNVQSTGPSYGYNESVNAALYSEFATSAFRFGHSQARKDFPRQSNAGQNYTTVDLGTGSFYSDMHYEHKQGGTESMLEGMMNSKAMSVDFEASFPIRNQIFEKRGLPGSGVDLFAVNVMRGRDVGLLPYNSYRKDLLNLNPTTTFDDFTSVMDITNIQRLRTAYSNIDDVDLFTAILMERPVIGGLIGSTGAEIIARQFSNLKNGDRFFFENSVRDSRGLSTDELDAIKKTSIAKVMCENSNDMTFVNEKIFEVASHRIPCSSLPVLDVSKFGLSIMEQRS